MVNQAIAAIKGTSCMRSRGQFRTEFVVRWEHERGSERYLDQFVVRWEHERRSSYYEKKLRDPIILETFGNGGLSNSPLTINRTKFPRHI